jgi:phospholipase/carboxylesterase
VFIAHGRRDPVIDIGFARRARARLEQAGLPVSYHESDAAHQIDPGQLPAAGSWLAQVTGRGGAGQPADA